MFYKKPLLYYMKNDKIQNGRGLFEKIVYIGTKKQKKIPTSLISVESH